MTDKKLMEQISKLGQLHIEGNIVPPSWYQHLKYPSGKPYHIAITLLSEIVYWFRPRMIRDEHTGEFAGWAKKFRGDGIQRSYAAWGAPFGFTKRESADAMKYLVSQGLITTVIRDIILADGSLRPNVVVVTGVDPDRLREITYSRKAGGPPPESSTAKRYAVSTEGVLPQNDIPEAGYDVSTEDVIPHNVPPSTDMPYQGLAAKRNCLETINETNQKTNNEKTHQGITAEEREDHRQVPQENINLFGSQRESESSQEITETESSKIAICPMILLKPKSRKDVLNLGKRPGREDFAFPNVAAACAWAARVWQTNLVLDPPEAEYGAMLSLLATLESTLAIIRERALREKKLTFTQVLDDYFGHDATLHASVKATRSPAKRLGEFATAIQDLTEQWDDEPSSNELAMLRSLLANDGDDVAA